MNFKEKQFKCKQNAEFFGFLFKDGPNDELYIYLYDLTSNKYIGFINLREVLGYNMEIDQIDYTLTKGSSKGSITLYSQDNLYLIA